MAEVPLVDLEVIVRYSLAIRQELAPAEEVLEALDESRALVLSLLGRSENGGEEQPSAEPGAWAAADDDHDAADAAGEAGVAGADDDAAFAAAAPAAGADAGVRPAPVGWADDEEEVAAGHGGYGEADLLDEVTAAEDQVALDDLADSGAEVDGTPGLDPGPAPRRRSLRDRAERVSTRGRRSVRRAARDAEPAVEPREADVFAREPQAGAEPKLSEPDDDQETLDEIERIRQRRIRKARQEAEERQARQAELARQAEQARRARLEEEAEEREARRIQAERRAARGPRRDDRDADEPRARRPDPYDEYDEPRRATRAGRGDGPDDLDLDLPRPLPADEAARRREERRRRRARDRG